MEMVRTGRREHDAKEGYKGMGEEWDEGREGREKWERIGSEVSEGGRK